MSHATTSKKSSNKAGEALKKNRSWTAAIVALVIAFVLAIGGTVFYGAVIQPQVLKSKDLAACKTFEYNYAQGQLAWVKEATATKHTPDPKVAVDNYLAHLFIGVNKGYTKADPNGPVAKSFQQLALSRLRYDSSSVTAIQSGFQTIDSEASSLKTYCDTLMPKASPSASN
jgi:hypothetical protein